MRPASARRSFQRSSQQRRRRGTAGVERLEPRIVLQCNNVDVADIPNVDEGVGTVAVTVQLTDDGTLCELTEPLQLVVEATNEGVRPAANPGEDFEPLSETLTIEVGETGATTSLTILDDTNQIESPELLRVRVETVIDNTDVTPGPGVILRISDNDPPGTAQLFPPDPAVGDENGGTVEFNLDFTFEEGFELATDPNTTVGGRVRIEGTDGSDREFRVGIDGGFVDPADPGNLLSETLITLEPGATGVVRKPVVVQLNDNTEEGNKDLKLRLFSVLSGALTFGDERVAEAVIRDDETGLNSEPQISSIFNQRVPLNETAFVDFSVSDVETGDNDLTIEVVGDNPEFLPESGIVLTGAGSDRALELTPVADREGNSRLTITVTDEGGLTAEEAFSFTASGLPPSFGPIADPTFPVGADVFAVPFTLFDETPPEELEFRIFSFNRGLIPQELLEAVPVGPGLWELRGTITAGQSGEGGILISVADAGGNSNSTSFTVTVAATLPQVTLSVDEEDISEVGGVATVTATLSAATTEDVIVDLAVKGVPLFFGDVGLATEGDDFVVAQKQLTIPAGSTTATTTVTAVEDDITEIDEALGVSIMQVVGAVEPFLNRNFLSIRIFDDDSQFFVTGTPGDDEFVVTVSGTTLTVELNDAVVQTASGPDVVILGDEGNDTFDVVGDIYPGWIVFDGEQGNDTANGGNGREILFGGLGDDLLNGGLGDDLVDGGPDEDTVNGGGGNNVIIGGDGSDNVSGDDEDDLILGSANIFGDLSGNSRINVSDVPLTVLGRLLANKYLTTRLIIGDPWFVDRNPYGVVPVDDGELDTIDTGAGDDFVVNFGDRFVLPFATLEAEIDVPPEGAFVFRIPGLDQVDPSTEDTTTHGDPLTITADDTSAQGGTVEVAGKNFVYTPMEDFAGTDTFQLVINNVDGLEIPGTITLNVPPPNGPFVTLNVDEPKISELDGVSVVTASLSRVANDDVTVSLGFSGSAIDGFDYDATGNQIVIPAGELTGAIRVEAIPDTNVEDDVVVGVEITTVTNASEFGEQSQEITILDELPPEVNVVPRTRGIEIVSDKPLDPATLSRDSIMVIGPDGEEVAGSFVLSDTGRLLTLFASNPLQTGEFEVTLRSGPTGITDIRGIQLDGDGDGTPGGDFVASFVRGGGAPTVSLPNLVAGPGQVAHVPATSANGLPVVLSSGANVRTVGMIFSYDPSLLEVTFATPGPDLPEGAIVDISASRPGLLVLQLSSPTDLPAGEVVLTNLQANVPKSAHDVYNKTQVLDIVSLTVLDLDQSPLFVEGVDGWHLNQHPGDLSGNGTINGSDASQVLQVIAGNRREFKGSPNLDAVRVADFNGNGRLDPNDAFHVGQRAIDHPDAIIPEIPECVDGERLGQGLRGRGTRVEARVSMANLLHWDIPQTNVAGPVRPAPLDEAGFESELWYRSGPDSAVRDRAWAEFGVLDETEDLLTALESLITGIEI